MDVFEASRNESLDEDEPDGSADDTLRHTQTFVESFGGEEISQGDSTRIYGQQSKP